MRESQELELANAFFSSPFASSSLKIRERRLDLCSHRRECARHSRDRAEHARYTRNVLDGAVDRVDIVLQVGRELVHRVLCLLSGLRVGLAKILQVGSERLRRRLRVVGCRLQPILGWIALHGTDSRCDRGLPVVIDEQTPLAQDSVAEAAVVVVELPPLPTRSPSRKNRQRSHNDQCEEETRHRASLHLRTGARGQQQAASQRLEAAFSSGRVESQNGRGTSTEERNSSATRLGRLR